MGFSMEACVVNDLVGDSLSATSYVTVFWEGFRTFANSIFDSYSLIGFYGWQQ